MTIKRAFIYQKLLTSLNDTLFDAEAQKQLGAVIFDYEIRKNKVRSTCLKRKKPLRILN